MRLVALAGGLVLFAPVVSREPALRDAGDLPGEERSVLLTTRQIFETMRKAGFPPTVAVTMTAIALRESGGDPAAFNGNAKTGDRSYGLLQINCLYLGARALTLFGITDEKELLDPAVNAHAGFVLWGRKNANLDEAWYLDKPVYKERYELHLPAAMSAALESPLGIGI
jgi:hypothetical protein